MENAPEDVILEDLSSPRKSVQVSALFRAGGFAHDERVLARLEELKQDPDSEIAVFAELAIIRSRKKSEAAIDPDAAAPEAACLSAERLLHCRKKDAPALLEQIRKTADTIPEKQRLVVGIFLAKFGEKPDATMLHSWLEQAPGFLAIPLLEALGALDREKALQVLPAYLASDRPFIRSRAILLLRNLDADESLNHLAELLGSENIEERLSGLSTALLFPFETVAPILFVMLAGEKEQEVFKQAALLVLSNPEMESASRLFELQETLPDPQRQWITAMIRLLGKALATIGAVDPAFAEPQAFVPWLKQHCLEKHLREVQIRLLLADPEQMPEIENWLGKNANEPQVAAFLQTLRQDPATEELARRLLPAEDARAEVPAFTSTAEKVGSAGDKPSETADAATSQLEGQTPAALKTASPESLKTPESRKQVLLGLKGAIPDDCLPWILEEARQGADDLKAAALAVLAQAPQGSGAVSIAEESLGQANPLVVCRAIRLLEKHAPEQLQKQALSLFQHPDALVWTRVLFSALKAAPDEVIRQLTRLLQSREPTQRVHAVKAMMLCPFEKTQSAIVAALSREDHPQIAKGLILLLLNNPSFEVFELLELLPPAKHTGVALVIAQAREQLFAILGQLGLLPKSSGGTVHSLPTLAGAPNSSVAKEFVREPKSLKILTEPGQAAEKAYSAQQVRQVVRQRKMTQKLAAETAGGDSLLEQTWFWWLSAGVCACLTFAGILQVSSRQDAFKLTPGVQESAPYISVDGFRMNVLCRLKGRIDGLASDQTIRFSAENRRFRLKTVASAPALFGVDIVEAEIVPYRQISTGEILAYCYSLKIP
jgi:hypothetical protein